MTGRIKVGKPANDSQLKKAVVEITDTSKVRGDTINIFSTAGIGGEVSAGLKTLGPAGRLVAGLAQPALEGGFARRLLGEVAAGTGARYARCLYRSLPLGNVDHYPKSYQIRYCPKRD